MSLSEEVLVAARPRCTHHWMVGLISSERSRGVCKRCGVARTFLPYSYNRRGFTTRGTVAGKPQGTNATLGQPKRNRG